MAFLEKTSSFSRRRLKGFLGKYISALLGEDPVLFYQKTKCPSRRRPSFRGIPAGLLLNDPVFF